MKPQNTCTLVNVFFYCQDNVLVKPSIKKTETTMWRLSDFIWLLKKKIVNPNPGSHLFFGIHLYDRS